MTTGGWPPTPSTVQVFDYLFPLAHGSIARSAASKIIERMQGETERRGGE